MCFFLGLFFCCCFTVTVALPYTARVINSFEGFTPAYSHVKGANKRCGEVGKGGGGIAIVSGGAGYWRYSHRYVGRPFPHTQADEFVGVPASSHVNGARKICDRGMDGVVWLVYS